MPDSVLLRKLGPASATALVISNMIGTGIFTTTGFLARDLGSPKLVLLSWAVGAVCALLGALCYAELGSNFPRSGGEYVYLREAFGPIWGFLTGWVSFFAGFSAPVAAAALAFADYLGAVAPGLRGSGAAQAVAAALITTLTCLNCFGIQRGARVQNALTLLKLAILGSFVIAGLAFGRGDWAHLRANGAHAGYGEFAVSLFWIYLSYSGWNAATYVAEEIRNPQRILPLALTLGTGLVAVLYLAMNVVMFYAVPLDAMKGVMGIAGEAAAYLFSPRIAALFSAAIAMSLIATVNAMTIAGPRVYFAMARDGLFFSRAARVHPRWRTPVAAIVGQGICAILLTFTPFPQLVVYVGFTLNFFACLAVLSLFRFRARTDWKRLPAVSFAYPLVPALAVIIGAWMTWEGIRLRPAISAATGATLLLGAFIYTIRYGARKKWSMK